jgi:hypothetical protein
MATTKRRKNKLGGAMTIDQVEARKDRGVEGLRRMGNDDAADKLDDESVEEFAERKRITIVNPRKKGSAKRKRTKNLFGFGGGKKVISKEEAEDLKKDAARSHCNKGDYSLAKKTARMSPRRFARQRGMQLEGVVSKTKKRVKAAARAKLLPLLEENPRRRRRNGSVEDAGKMFEKFHGRKPTTVQDIKTRQNDRRNLSGLGRLMYLQTSEGLPIKFSERDKVILASDPAGNQLYFVGGNQNMTSILQQAKMDTSKDLIDVGECQFIIYTTDKDFDNFEEKDYQHEFGEETGEMPRLMYDRLNQVLFLIGGAYEIKREGIVN